MKESNSHVALLSSDLVGLADTEMKASFFGAMLETWQDGATGAGCSWAHSSTQAAESLLTPSTGKVSCEKHFHNEYVQG